ERLAAECPLDLSSPENVGICLEFLSPCAAQGALGAAIPRIGDLLALLGIEADNSLACLPAPSGAIHGGLASIELGNTAVRCQRFLANSGRKLLKRQLGT